MLRLTREDVEKFAAASGDYNPLHVSPEYARTTAFGQPIAHGVLGLLLAARELPDRSGKRLRKIAIEFPRPLLLDTDYTVEVREDGPDASSLEVLDGSKPVLRGVLEFGESSRGGGMSVVVEPKLREVAASPREFERGQVVSGNYGLPDPDWHGLLPLGHKGINRGQLLALMLCSYVIGMELPGERALFTRLTLEFGDCPRNGELTWEARVDGWQARTGAIRVGLELRVDGSAWAKGSLRAFVQSEAVEGEQSAGSGHLDPQAFAGTTALVIGASRGLGRSLVRSFAAHGGRVFAVSRSPLDEELLASGSITPIEADASDPEELARALEGIDEIDLLVCNASPPLQPLTLEPATATRVRDHIQNAVALVSIPLALCLPRLAQTHGIALLSSSQAVAAPPAEWAHYVAAKRAAEGLFEVAALQYPDVGFVVARMPRLDTAFTLNVAGEPAASANSVALRLLERVDQPEFERGRVEIISSFDRG